MIMPDDTAALLALTDAIGFEPNELEVLSKMLADYFAGNSDSNPKSGLNIPFKKSWRSWEGWGRNISFIDNS